MAVAGLTTPSMADAMSGSSKRNASISQEMSTSSGSRVRLDGTIAMSSKPYARRPDFPIPISTSATARPPRLGLSCLCASLMFAVRPARLIPPAPPSRRSRNRYSIRAVAPQITSSPRSKKCIVRSGAPAASHRSCQYRPGATSSASGTMSTPRPPPGWASSAGRLGAAATNGRMTGPDRLERSSVGSRPSTSTSAALRATSSSASRRAAARGSSPGSMRPPGKAISPGIPPELMSPAG